MKEKFLLLLVLLFSIVAHAETPVDSLLRELDNTIEKRDEFIKKKEANIVLIKQQLVPGDEKAALLVRYSVSVQLFEEYKSFIYDSAFSYGRVLIQTAYKLNDKSIINDAKVKMSFTLLSAGMFKEALDTLNSVDSSSLTKDSRIEYYSILARTYYDLANYSNDGYFSERYDKRGNAYLQQALSLCEPNSIRFLLMRGLAYMRARDTLNAIKTFETVLKDPKLAKHDIAIASSSVSYMYRLTKDFDKAKEYLAKAAIADIISSTRETVAIRDLAEVLYDEGNIERSYKYVKVALADAYFYGAKHRKIQIANILPIIESTQLEIVQGQKKNLLFYSIIATVLALFIILFAIIIYRQYRKLDEAKLKLALSYQNIEKANVQLEETNSKLGEINNRLEDANKIKLKKNISEAFLELYPNTLKKLKNSRIPLTGRFSKRKLKM